jgi:SulP family sulfate permease
MLEANTIGKSIAVTTGQRLNKNQEVFALGCANFFLCFFHAIPCSGSASRTVVNVQHGAQTRFAAIFSGIIVAAIVFFLGNVFQYVPLASLAALLIATAFRMIDYSQFKLCIRSTRSDALVLFVTFFSCIFFSLPLAFYMGVALSIILFLRKAAMPRVSEVIFNEHTGEFRPASEEERKTPHPIRIINVEGELFFGAVDLFQHTLRAIAEDDVTTKAIVLRLKHVHDLDATTALALKQLKNYLDQSHRHLVVCSIPEHVVELLENAHLTKVLGPNNIIPLDHGAPHTVLGKAVSRARKLIQEE